MNNKIGAVLIAIIVSLLTSNSSYAGFDPAPLPFNSPSPHPILSDLSVRKAIALCTDKDALIQSAYPLLTAAEREFISGKFICAE